MRIFLLWSILTGCSFFAQGQTAKELIEKAQDLASDNKYDSALLMYNQAAGKDTNLYSLYTGRGFVYYNLDSLNDGFMDLTKAIERWPDSALAYNYRGMLLSKVLYTDESIADYTMALSLADNDTLRKVIYVNRGVSYGLKRDFQAAYEDYSRAYLMDTLGIGVINNLAGVLDELGRTDESIAYLKKITARDPSFIGGWVNLGFQYSKLGKYKEAIGYFNTALQLGPDEAITLNNRGYAYLGLKQYDKALADINRSLSLYPGNSYAYRNRALVYLAMKQTAKACPDLKEALARKFTEVYGLEVQELYDKHCGTK